MAGPDPLVEGGILVAAAFAIPVIFTVMVRNAERYNREPLGGLFASFLYGAVLSVVVAVVLEAVFNSNFQREYQLGGVTVPQVLLLAVVGAPLVEEFSKGLGVRAARGRIRELEDGIIYGAAAGLGFSATENLFYELSALSADGGYSAVAVGVIRSLSSSLLHATASGILGYGMAKRYLERGILLLLLPYYALAVLLHSSFNLFASLTDVGGVPLGGTFLVIVISIGGIRWTLHRIRRLDSLGAYVPRW